MIGQNDLKGVFIHSFIEGNKPLPRSILLTGSKGSGRKTFASWILSSVGLPLVIIGNKVDDIRELSSVCYKVVEPTYYLIPDIEQMSVAAQNALLKILEEPPNSVGFILTTVQEDLILSTIRSRCVMYYMDAYSEAEIDEYVNSKYSMTDELNAVLHSVCICPGDVDILINYDIADFGNYVETVFKNIGRVSGANSFKIANRLNVDDSQAKFDLVLFWRAFINMCIEHFAENPKKYMHGVTVTTTYMQDLRIKGLNKQMAVDNWILDIRKEWINADD